MVRTCKVSACLVLQIGTNCWSVGCINFDGLVKVYPTCAHGLGKLIDVGNEPIPFFIDVGLLATSSKLGERGPFLVDEPVERIESLEQDCCLA